MNLTPSMDFNGDLILKKTPQKLWRIIYKNKLI